MSPETPTQPKHSGARLITRQQEAAWFAMLFTEATVTSRIDRDLQREHGLSYSAVEILCRLYDDEEPRSLRSLADQLVSVSSTRASRLVQELIDAGHLQRGADQRDGRKSLISLTPEGRRYSEVVARTLEDAIIRHFLAPLDDDDIAAIQRVWDKLRVAQAAEPAGTRR